MIKKFTIFLILVFILGLTPISFSNAQDLSSRLSGKILLQVENVGQAWYIDPETKERAFLGRPADAFRIMRELGLGISEKNYNSFNGYAPSKLSGKILLRVEANGEAYYVFPDDLKIHYLGRPTDAFNIMREKGLGIKNEDLNKVPIFEKYKEQLEKQQKIIDAQIESEETIKNIKDEEIIDSEIITGTEVQGIISQDTTWMLERSPYIIKGSILVEENATLIIEPGVNIFVDRGRKPESGIPGSTYIKVKGSLMANGTFDNKIIFTSSEIDPQPRDWRGIIHEGINESVVEISYCNIFYADVVDLTYIDKFNHSKVAYGGWGIINAGEIANNIIEHNFYGIFIRRIGVDNFKFNIQNNIIRFNEKDGIRLNHVAVIKNNDIINNNGAGIRMYRDTSSSEITTNNIHDNNGYNVLCLYETCNLKQNWWGTTNLPEIEEKLFDYYDDFELGKINYQPILQSKVEFY
ncbi:hypothetical protein KAI65_06405 [Candidatus Parcubacteria bacterium]|nr:hypothetical protein [Candidatus Parcubacteria bacterium]